MSFDMPPPRDADTQILDKITNLHDGGTRIRLDLTHDEAGQMASLLRDGLRFRAGWQAIKEAELRRGEQRQRS